MARAGVPKTSKGRLDKSAQTTKSDAVKAKARATKRRTHKAPSPLKLYWCETDDHGEDWFIVARSVPSACKWHEDAEGYDRGDADAELICELPAFVQKTTKAGWPSRAVLEACGGEILKGTGQDEQPRVVRIKGRVFGAGLQPQGATAREFFAGSWATPVAA